MPTIRSTIIVESRAAGLTLLRRDDGAAPGTATTLTIADAPHLPELDATIPVAEIYEDVEVPH